MQQMFKIWWNGLMWKNCTARQTPECSLKLTRHITDCCNKRIVPVYRQEGGVYVQWTLSIVQLIKFIKSQTGPELLKKMEVLFLYTSSMWVRIGFNPKL